MQGQKILHFEEKIGPFLFNVFPYATDTDYLASFLTIVLNMIKFNPAYLDAEVVCGFVDILGTYERCRARCNDDRVVARGLFDKDMGSTGIAVGNLVRSLV